MTWRRLLRALAGDGEEGTADAAAAPPSGGAGGSADAPAAWTPETPGPRRISAASGGAAPRRLRRGPGRRDPALLQRRRLLAGPELRDAGSLNGVWGSGPDDVFAVGRHFAVDERRDPALHQRRRLLAARGHSGPTPTPFTACGGAAPTTSSSWAPAARSCTRPTTAPPGRPETSGTGHASPASGATGPTTSSPWVRTA